MKDVQIRRLRAADADEISRIYGAITQKPVDIDFKRIIKKDTLRDGVCLVAELDGKVVGFMISYVLTLGFGIEKSAWIATLGVNPAFMGRGIGESLAKEILQFYKNEGINNVFTTVRWDSADLLSFFKTLGFDRSNFINLRKNLE